VWKPSAGSLDRGYRAYGLSYPDAALASTICGGNLRPKVVTSGEGGMIQLEG